MSEPEFTITTELKKSERYKPWLSLVGAVQLVQKEVGEDDDIGDTMLEAATRITEASAKIEKLICSTPEAANADKRLAAACSAAKAKVADEKMLKAEQLEWMKQQRNVCRDVGCLVKVSDERIQKLSSM